MNSRKYPRTLNEAFGPYTSHEIQSERDSDYGVVWWLAMVAIAVSSVVIVVLS